MTVFQVVALLLTLTAIFSYVNFRFIRLPSTIGVMLVALVASLALSGLGHFDPELQHRASAWMKEVDFDQTLMQGMLSFLLFAGALHINLNDLFAEKAVVGVLAVGGVLISTVLFGAAVYLLSGWLKLGLGLGWCLLFGALISPTDPIAVMSILKTAKAPRSLEIQIAGESLFNDGVGVVAYLLCLEIVQSSSHVGMGHIGVLLVREALGGAAFGLAIGYVTFLLLRSVDQYQVEVLLTLALVSGGYALASALHLSGPIAIVVAGLLIGNHGRTLAMSATTRERLDMFWELIDEVLNGVLFVLVGLEVLVLSFSARLLLAGILCVPLLLLARWVSVGLPVAVMKQWRTFSPGSVKIMTWGGLRGGISVALALSLPPGGEKHALVILTYVIVVFSIVVQGLTVGRVVKKTVRSG